MMKRFQTLLSISTGAASQRWREIAKSESRPGLEFGTAVTKVGRCMLTVSIPVLGNGGIFALFWSKLGLGHRYIDFRVPVHPCQGHDNRGVIALFQGFSKSRVSFLLGTSLQSTGTSLCSWRSTFPGGNRGPRFLFLLGRPPQRRRRSPFSIDVSMLRDVPIQVALGFYFIFFPPRKKKKPKP
jgi:hypothetical protein